MRHIACSGERKFSLDRAVVPCHHDLHSRCGDSISVIAIQLSPDLFRPGSASATGCLHMLGNDLAAIETANPTVTGLQDSLLLECGSISTRHDQLNAP